MIENIAAAQGVGAAVGFAEAFAASGMSDMGKFQQMMTEAQTAKSAGSAQALQDVAKKYGLSAQDFTRVNETYQNAKHMGEVNQAVAAMTAGGLGAMSYAAAGDLAGRTSGAEAGSKAAVASRNLDDYMQAHRDMSMKQLADDKQFRNLAGHLLASTPGAVGEDGNVTDLGSKLLAERMAGANQASYTNGDGSGSQKSLVGADGKVGSTEGWQTMSGKDDLLRLATALGNNGYGQNAAYVKSLAANGGALKYSFAKDKNGNIATFSIDKGGQTRNLDLAARKAGKDFEWINRNVNTADIGTHSWQGSERVQAQINEVRLSNGTVMNSGTAFQAMVSGRGATSLTNTFTHAKGGEREAQQWNYAATVSQGMKGLVQVSGQDATELAFRAASSLTAGVSTGSWNPFFKASLQGSLEAAASGKTTHVEQKDLVTMAMHAASDATLKSADAQGLKGVKRDAYVANTMQKFTQAYVAAAAGDANYGKDAVTRNGPAPPSGREVYNRGMTKVESLHGPKYPSYNDIKPPANVPISQNKRVVGRSGIKGKGIS
ncbi:hypothetical protein [Geobacter pickeringii]|uniref:Uncharacterized protein n=1 Tax=Geobacter pickeringii TaxID=345632 RepID=A0A0B5BGF7_9BACT|nr:hypothetical protein [Geobacter pickeringii]AJE03595.1 hypothetical protein GPICK_09740 [Geobacter pickeringii]